MSIIKNPSANLSLKSYRNVIILIIIAALSLGARIIELPFSYGVTIALGNLFIFIILNYYSVPVACITAVVVNLINWILLDGSVNTMFSVMEIFVVGVIWKNKLRNLFMVDAVYWIILGVPSMFLMFYVNRGTVGLEGCLFVTNSAITGLVNVLLAEIVLSYFQIQRIFGLKEKKLTDLYKMFLHITVVVIVAPFLINTMLDSYLTSDKLSWEICQKLKTANLNIMEKVENLDKGDIRKIRLSSPIHLKKFKEIIDNNPLNKEVEVLLVDKDNKVYVSDKGKEEYGKVYNWKEGGKYAKIEDNIYMWLPVYDKQKFSMGGWNQAFYIMIVPFEGVDLQLQIIVPLATVTEVMWRNFMNKFMILLAFSFLSILISKMMSRFLAKDLSKLTQSTTGLPDKLRRQEEIEWPDPSIVQINALTSNFRAMSDNLVDLFNEAKIMNKRLLYQTKELEDSSEKMRFLAYNDVLTGLPNRLYFTNYLQALLDSVYRMNIAVMFLDLNRFKQINDTLGHEIGDLLIKEVAKRLRDSLPDDSLVARLGGDEFVIVLKDTDREKAAETAIHINDALSEAIKINQKGNMHELYVSGSIGISLYPNDANERSALLKNADLAMYAAKETGDSTFRFYSDLTESNMAEQLVLEQGLCKALERNEIIICYQPRISFEDKNICGMEALIRWKHPQKGLIQPSQFIHLAEETGIINSIGEWVIIEACKQNKKWQDMGYPEMRVSVNLSLKQFFGNNVIKSVTKALEISGLEPEYLELEITEGFFMNNIDFIVSVLKELKRIGVYISIDDFGMGYSSLGRLKELPIQLLKIDKSFINNVSIEKNNSAIVSTIIQLAHSMGLKVVAEGVENIIDYDYLESIGCDEVQGYLFSEPLLKDDFEKLINKFSFRDYKLELILKGELKP